MNKDVEIKISGGNVIVTNKGETVFCKPKTEQSIAVANSIYFYYRYK